jgi:hypothetical protein
MLKTPPTAQAASQIARVENRKQRKIMSKSN